MNDALGLEPHTSYNRTTHNSRPLFPRQENEK